MLFTPDGILDSLDRGILYKSRKRDYGRGTKCDPSTICEVHYEALLVSCRSSTMIDG